MSESGLLRSVRRNGPLPGEGGAPEKPIDVALAVKLAGINCTDVEIAHILNVSHDTLARRKQSDPEFLAAFEHGRASGKASLRRKQFEKAMAGSDTMLIWLGKQLLGQRDRHELSAEDGASPVMLHLLAVREVGRQLIEERATQPPPTIQHEPITNSPASILDAPPPLE